MPAAIALLRHILTDSLVERVVGPTLGRTGAVDGAAPDITGHEAQTGNSISAEVEVVACLPGAFVGAVEVGVFDRVGQVYGVAADEVEWCVAIDALPGQGKGMSLNGVFARQTVGGVVDGTGQRLAAVLRAIQVGVEEPSGPFQVQIAVVLPPGVA